MSQIRTAINRIQDEIKSAQERSPYGAKDVLLLAVTKNVDAERMKEAMTAGISAFGENRVQEIEKKYDQIPTEASWHLIGHLQKNKVKYIINKVALIHSLDSTALAEEINKRAQQVNLVMPVLVQVNVADEETKFGVTPDEAIPLIQGIRALPHLKISGLMTIAPLVDEAEKVRPVFRQLRELRDQIQEMNLPGVSMDYLSMGMTNDYQIAVEEGANIVRIGSGIFGARLPN
ncbi:YggS family pyridoxal phosphate-dependent enzyme [Dehalobacterium formicoaceticum]|uniref:Pyridoxal phosphate homeostasis protein n=1 Tax=Dehalobacterium formicoaceticum TaxID=51515 RepID=A0ABT1Y101_9FIRM|nr:YggS family pyridoxal phosphate-dependent enzyme [Dehalobacterium formicoaceticum]MCR6544536.1 YggS family pyridoxal phosphate-dependent enzyme [Dehalobacterium formicoaceticum]